MASRKTIKKQHKTDHDFSQKKGAERVPKADPWRGLFRQHRLPGPPRPPQDTKHVERPPKTPKYHQKVTNRTQNITKKCPTDHKISEKRTPRTYFSTKKRSSPSPNPIPIQIPVPQFLLSKRTNQTSQTNQTNQTSQTHQTNQTHITKRNCTPILQSPIPGPAECAKRLNNIWRI